MRFIVDIPLEDLLGVKEEHETDSSLAGLISFVLASKFKNTFIRQLDLVCPQCGNDDLECDRPLFKEYNKEDIVLEFKCTSCGTRFPREAKIDYGVKNIVT